MRPEGERTPPDLREGVRSGILASLERDLERRGGRTAGRLLAAGVIGVLGAVGVTLPLTGHPYGHHPSWHAVVFGAVWTGLLVVCLSLALLEVHTPSLPLARAALVAMLGLGLAGICGAACPDQHFLHWWSGTALGAELTEAGGPALGALCFGLVTTLAFGAGAALVGLATRREHMRPLLPAAMLLMLFAPGVALQSIDTSWGVFWSWPRAVSPWHRSAFTFSVRACSTELHATPAPALLDGGPSDALIEPYGDRLPDSCRLLHPPPSCARRPLSLPARDGGRHLEGPALGLLLALPGGPSASVERSHSQLSAL